MPSRHETPILIGRDPSKPIPIEPYLRMRRIKQRQELAKDRLHLNRLTPIEVASEARKKATRRKLRNLQESLTVARAAAVLAPVVAAGAIALHSWANQPTSKPSEETKTLQTPEPQSDIVIERNITIRLGFVDILPGANLRTSPNFEDGNLFGTVRESLRVHNPETVLGAKADPTVKMSSDRMFPYNDPWFSFSLEGTQVFVNAGPATSDVIDIQYAGELTSVNRIRSGQLSYYESPFTGEGLGSTRVELAPPPINR